MIRYLVLQAVAASSLQSGRVDALKDHWRRGARAHRAHTHALNQVVRPGGLMLDAVEREPIFGLPQFQDDPLPWATLARPWG